MKRLTDNVATIMAGFVLLLAAAFLVTPMLMVVVMSFDARDYLGRFPPPGLSLRWYYEFFSDPYFMEGLRTSIYLALLAAGISTAVGAAAALCLDRYRFAGQQAVIALFLSPLVVPSIVMGFSLLLFLSAIGVYDGFARLLAGHVIITLPYTIRTTLASLAGVRKSLYEAALGLGASEGRAYRDIVLPLAKTGVAAGAIFALSLSMDEVTLSLFLIDPFSYTLPVALFSTMRDNFNLTIAAASVVMMFFTAFVLLIADRIIGLNNIIGVRIYQ
jgi:putative spermidine/putrescine transport system permease protein